MDLKRVFAELEALLSARVVQDYALGGAVGATYYVEPAATQDVDIFVAFTGDSASSLAQLTPIYDFLTKRGATIEGGHLMIGDWPIQILPASGPLLEDAIAEARTVDLEGQRLRVFSAEHLAALALDVGRTKDKLRLAQFLEWTGFDRPRFEALVERHGLVAKWRAFHQAFGSDPGHPNG